MNRLTEKTDQGYIVSDMQGAIDKLAFYENIHENLLAQQRELAQRLSEMRALGKEKTVKYREMLTQKLQNTYVISLLERSNETN